MIDIQKEENLNADEFIDLLKRSTLAERRPVSDFQKISAMIKNANIIVTARQDNLLVGVARSISDFVYCTYLSDLAVDEDFQHKGIGKMLIKETKNLSPDAKLILLSAPKAVDYYPKIGFTRHSDSFYINHVSELK